MHTGESWLCDSALLQHVHVAYAGGSYRRDVVMAQQGDPWPMLDPDLLQAAVRMRHSHTT